MCENTSNALQIVNIVLTALSPIILALAYCTRRITKSKCCSRIIELDISRKDSNKTIV